MRKRAELVNPVFLAYESGMMILAVDNQTLNLYLEEFKNLSGNENSIKKALYLSPNKIAISGLMLD